MCVAVNSFQRRAKLRSNQHDWRPAGSGKLLDFCGNQTAHAADVPGRQANRQPIFAVLEARPNPLLQRRIERHDVQAEIPIAVPRANRAGQPLTDELRQQDRVLGARA